MRLQFFTDACWNGASSWPWASITVQHLFVGTQKLRRDTSKLMAFHFIGFIIFYVSAKQPLQLKREWKRCEAQILMRHTLSVHAWAPATRCEPPMWMCSPAQGQAVTPRLHKEVPRMHGDLRSLQHLCQGAFSPRDNKPKWALLWCSNRIDSGTCWGPAASLSSGWNAEFS